MKEPTVLQLLWQNSLCYEHILQQIFLYLDSSSIRNLKLSNMELRNFVQRVLWQNKRSHRCLHYRLKNRWVHSVWKSLKMSHFHHFFVLLMSTQNVNVARFARNVEWDFFCDFQTPWVGTKKEDFLWCFRNNLVLSALLVMYEFWLKKTFRKPLKIRGKKWESKSAFLHL